jgi:hypothetical protein
MIYYEYKNEYQVKSLNLSRSVPASPIFSSPPPLPPSPAKATSLCPGRFKLSQLAAMQGNGPE